MAAEKLRYSEENARYIVVGTSRGPSPELVLDESKIPEVQKVSPEVPP
jgi:hypothetical protein